MSRVELTHWFADPLRDGFDYIVDPRNWSEYAYYSIMIVMQTLPTKERTA